MGRAVAKSNKRAWRKLDATAAQDGLVADARALLRSADPSSKKDNELFFVDKQGAGARKGRREPWELKSAQILSPNAKIPVVPKNAPKQKKWHTITGKIERMQTQLQGSGQIAEFARKKARVAAPAPVAAERAFDLWGEEQDVEPVAKIVAPGAGLCDINAPASNGWPTVYKNNPHVLSNAVATLDPEHFVSGRKRKHRLTQMKPVPSKTKSVPVAAQGASYRPPPQAHQALMAEAAGMIVQEEVKLAAARQRLGLKDGQRLKKGNLARDGNLPGADDLSEDEVEDPAEALIDQGQGGGQEGEEGAAAADSGDSDDSEDEEGGAEGGGGAAASGKGKEQGKLTRTQRNKQARHAERQRQLAAAREEKKIGKQINALGDINKQVKAQLRKAEEEAKQREADKPDKEAARIHRLGPQKLTPADFIPAVQLPEEIAPKLRVVKQASNALKDSFLNLAKRNMIEPRRKTANTRKDKTLAVRKADKIKARAYIDF